MTQFVFFMLNHLWQSTLVVGLAWLACAIMLRNNSPRVRFGVWFAASLKFLTPFTVLVEAGRRLGVPLVKPSQSREIYEIVSTAPPTLATSPFRAAAAATAPGASQDVWLFVLLAVWVAGAGVVFFRWLRHWLTLRSVARAAQPAGDFRGVPILNSDRLREERIEPGVFGIWRQSILVPEGMDARLSTAQLQVILNHEWSHVQRRDNLTAWLHMMTEGIFWFYPVVWLVGRKLIEEREQACDQTVLEWTRPDDYVESILTVCKFYCASAHGHATGITSADLRARVELILKNERPRALGRARRCALAAALIVGIAAPTLVGLLTAQAIDPQGNSFVGMATSAEKQFEVATIKLNNSGTNAFQLGPPRQGSIAITNVPLRGIIAQSFRTSAAMLVGAPAWTASKRYDIVGQGPDPSVGNPEVWEMMRSLLIERVHLKYHIEDREMPVFALTVGPRGHKLILGENGKCKDEIKAGNRCGDLPGAPFGTSMYNMPIGALITGIGQRAGRPIIDRTGLTGRYDLILSWVPAGMRFDDLNLEGVPKEFRPEDVSLSEALERQAGLKLEPTRAPMPVLVIDSVTEPDPN
jgi:bla regulator protein blaR1